MAENLLVLSPRLSDAATITASSQASSSLVPANLQNIQPSKKWRSLTTTGEYVLVTFGSAVAADTLAVVGHNLSSSGTIRVRGAIVQANLTSAPDVDSGAVSAWPTGAMPSDANWPVFTSIVRNFNLTPKSCQYWRIDFADAAPLTTYLEAGRLALGLKWQPASGDFATGGTPLGFDTLDVQTKTQYGRIFTDARNVSPARIFQLSIYALTRREAFDGIYDIQRTRGQWGDVVVALDPAETTDFHRWTMQGVFTAAPAYNLPAVYDSNGSMFGAGINLRELL